ncbi:MAG: hypothetical protein ACRDK8_00400 [Solirubrobacteraceae bacterium]
MLPILAAAAPLAALAVLFLTCRTGSRSADPARGGEPHGPYRSATEGRWEGLSAEVARLERRRPLPGSDAAMRRRHLAAVLPADARR